VFHNGSAEAVRGLKLPITVGDISFLLEDIYRGRSVVSGIPTRPMLIRWRLPENDTMTVIGSGADEQKSANVKLSGLVCMTKEEAARHLKEVLLGRKQPEEIYDKDTLDRVHLRIEETKRYENEYR